MFSRPGAAVTRTFSDGGKEGRRGARVFKVWGRQQSFGWMACLVALREGLTCSAGGDRERPMNAKPSCPVHMRKEQKPPSAYGKPWPIFLTQETASFSALSPQLRHSLRRGILSVFYPESRSSYLHPGEGMSHDVGRVSLNDGKDGL